MSRPLVLTLRLDKGTADFLTGLRATYFPKHRNHLNAHVTLFHAIPPSRRSTLDRAINEICARQSAFEISVWKPSEMGKRGVMVRIGEEKRGVIEGLHRTIVERLSGQSSRPRPPGHADSTDRNGQNGPGDYEDAEGLGEEGLTEQDLAPLRSPHVTVLNKATTEEQVERCYADLEDLFGGMEGGKLEGRAIGFQLWEYDRGPWTHLRDYSFIS